MVPTGRYEPGATNNVGTGYFGNHLLTGVNRLHHQEQRDQCEHLHRLGGSRSQGGYERHQQDAWPSPHFRVGPWPSSPVEKELQPTAAAWPHWIRPVASNGKRRHCTDWVDQSDHPSQPASLLLGARHRWTGQLHSPREESKLLRQGLSTSTPHTLTL